MHQIGPADQPARPACAHRHAQAAHPARPGSDPRAPRVQLLPPAAYAPRASCAPLPRRCRAPAARVPSHAYAPAAARPCCLRTLALRLHACPARPSRACAPSRGPSAPRARACCPALAVSWLGWPLYCNTVQPCPCSTVAIQFLYCNTNSQPNPAASLPSLL